MLKIWGRTNSINVQKAMWAIAELGLPHQRIDAGGPFGGLDTPEYKAKNPNSRIPTIDDNGVVVWESNTVVRYLAGKHGMGTLCPTDPRQRADADRWMDWTANHLNPPITPVFWGLIRTPPEKRDMQQIEAEAEKVGQQLQVLEQGLEGKDYVAGKTFTMGDIVVGVFVWRWYALPVKHPKMPRIEAYHERLKQRPAFQKHVAKPLT